MTFPRFVFHSSSPDAVANAEEYKNDLITELRGVQPTIFICALEVSAMQSVIMTIFRVLRTLLIGKTPFAMTSLTNGRLSKQQSPRGLLLTQAAKQDCWAVVVWHNLEWVETKNQAHSIEFACLEADEC